MRGLPVVVVPVPADEAALDACLHALDRSTPAGTRVWLADDAQAGPRGRELVERWLPQTALRAGYTRRTRAIGEAAHIDEALRACGEADVAVVAGNARPAPGWLQAMADALADASVATVTPWSNAGGTVAFPRMGQTASLPPDLTALASACANLTPALHELPAAGAHAVLVRSRALRSVGGLDTTGYTSWYGALTDLSLRLAGLGWRNVLGACAYVACEAEAQPATGDEARLAARWPDWHARLGHMLMSDPLYRLRERLAQRLHEIEASGQAGLFAEAASPAVEAADDACLPLAEPWP